MIKNLLLVLLSLFVTIFLNYNNISKKNYIKISINLSKEVNEDVAKKYFNIILKKNKYKYVSAQHVLMINQSLDLVKNSPNEFFIEKFNDEKVSFSNFIHSKFKTESVEYSFYKIGNVEVLTEYYNVAIFSITYLVKTFAFVFLFVISMKELVKEIKKLKRN